MNVYLKKHLQGSLGELLKNEASFQGAECLIQVTLPDRLNLLRYLYAAQERVCSTITARRQEDVATVGANFRADGIGLRDDYCISGPESESMCDIARAVLGVFWGTYVRRR